MSGVDRRAIALPRARRHVRDVIRWYRQDNPRAAEGFRLAFKEALEVLAKAPLRWAEVSPGVRRYLLPRYPYTLTYAIRGAQVIILAVLHQARDPDTWRRGHE